MEKVEGEEQQEQEKKMAKSDTGDADQKMPLNKWWESEFLWKIVPIFYPWSLKGLENLTVSIQLTEVLKCWKQLNLEKNK